VNQGDGNPNKPKRNRPARNQPAPGKLDARLLPRALTPWTDSLPFARCDGVDDSWLERAAVCSGLRVLDITNCNLVGGFGLRGVGAVVALLAWGRGGVCAVD
jgi:hypothetical protein